MKRFVLILTFFTTLTGCPAPLPVLPPSPTTCAGICARGAALGCTFAKPTPKGATCETVCLNLLASDLPMWNLSCRSMAASCAAIDACQ